jgi:hypothetical protein
MSDHSLMNPDFLKKELADSRELLAKAETHNREFSIAYDEIFNTFMLLDLAVPGRKTYSITQDQMSLIIRTLAKVKQNEFVYLSPRKVHISQLKQLLQDRRWRIATTLSRFFK